MYCGRGHEDTDGACGKVITGGPVHLEKITSMNRSEVEYIFVTLPQQILNAIGQ